MQLPVAMEAATNKGKSGRASRVRIVSHSDIIQGCLPWKSKLSHPSALRYEQSALDPAVKSGNLAKFHAIRS